MRALAEGVLIGGLVVVALTIYYWAMEPYESTRPRERKRDRHESKKQKDAGDAHLGVHHAVRGLRDREQSRGHSGERRVPARAVREGVHTARLQALRQHNHIIEHEHQYIEHEQHNIQYEQHDHFYYGYDE